MKFEFVPNDSGLELAAKNSLEIAFSGFFTEAQKWKDHAETITEPKLARTARLELKSLRVAAEKTRKELKADSLRMGKAIDGANNILLSLIVPIERQLDDVEKQEERRIAAEKAAVLAERTEAFQPFHDPSMPFPSLGAMTEEQFSQFLADTQTLAKAKAEAVAKAERERIATEKKEAEEREAQRLENIKLKKDAEAREKAIAAERAEEAKIQAKKDAEAAKERSIMEAKAKKEAEAREKAEAEARQLQAEKLAAEKAESERVAAEKANARRAAGAPDRMKLKAFAITVSLLELPSVKSPEAKDIHAEITKEVASFSRWIEEQADKL